MAQTLTAIYLHIVFSTKSREPTITPELGPRLHAYLGGIARNIGAVALAVGGIDDHVHILMSIPTTTSIADLVRTLKANSSRWVHEHGSPHDTFAWQTGYGAFSVSKSNVDNVITYIGHQAQHHQRMTFQEEFLELLKRHGVDYDPKYIWD